MLELKNIKKIYNPGLVTEMCLFDDFSLSVKDKEFVSIVGSNGSGKTSLLNILCGSIPMDGGDVLIENVIPKHLDCITAKLVEMGVDVEEHDDAVLVRRCGPISRVNVKTMPYPGFPTDMQPQIAAVLCLAHGTSVLTEGVWDNRYRYVDELKRMGASIQVDDKTAVVEGVDHLTGAPIQACDLRAGAALVIAALAAKGESEISCVQYIERGYEDIVTKLQGLGASIRTVEVPGESEELEAHIG